MAIRHKRKSTTGYTWVASDLVSGQIGVNTVDGTLHLRKDNDTVVTFQSGSSGGASTLDDLTDVVITTPSTNQVLQYNGTNWVNATVSSGGAETGANSDITSMDGLTGGLSTVDFITFDTVNAQTSGIGKLIWDDGNGTLSVGLKGGNVDLQIGQESVVRVYNGTGSTLTDGQVVYITGSQGQRLTVGLADADLEASSSVTIGVVTESITNATEGFITTHGMVNGLNTLGLTEGAAIWLSSTAGQFTTTKPSAPVHGVLIGYVVRAHATSGSIFVHIQNGYELNELHNVSISTPTNEQALLYNSTTSLWYNGSLVNDASTTSTTLGWSASKLNTTLGDISSALAAILG